MIAPAATNAATTRPTGLASIAVLTSQIAPASAIPPIVSAPNGDPPLFDTVEETASAHCDLAQGRQGDSTVAGVSGSKADEGGRGVHGATLWRIRHQGQRKSGLCATCVNMDSGVYDTMRPFAEILDAHLKSIGLKPIAAAERHGLNRDAIRSVMRGRSPSVDRAAEICSALGLEFYVGPPREASPSLFPDSETHRWGNRRGMAVTPYPVPMRKVISSGSEAPSAGKIGVAPNGCAFFGLDFLLDHDLNPKLCEVVEIFDDSMAPEFPSGAVGLVDLRRTEWVDGRVCALGIPDLTVRRTRRTADGWALDADNPRFEPIRREAYMEVQGQVVWTSHMVGVAAVI